VADGREGGVVMLGAHLEHLAAHGGPDVGGLLHHHGVGLWQWRQDDLAALVEPRIRMLDAGHFTPRDGVRGYERGQALLEHAPRGIDHIALGGADIHEQHAGVNQVTDGLERAFAGRHGHGDQHDVGARDGQQCGFGCDVDHADTARFFDRGGRLAVAHDPLDQASLLEGQRKRAPHQAAANQAELVEHGLKRSVHVQRVAAEHLEE